MNNTAKSLLSVMLMISMLLCMSACGQKKSENNPSDEDKTIKSQEKSENRGTNGNESDNISEESSTSPEENEDNVPTEEARSLSFGEWENVGNDPNNIYQSEYGLAFDDEYIYFNDGGIARIKYDGTQKNYVHDKGGADFVNVYNGYTYYTSSTGYTKDAYCAIYRINNETLEEEEIFRYSLEQYKTHEIQTLFLYKGYAFFSLYYDNDVTETTYIYALDLETLESYRLLSRDNELNANFVCDNDGNIYLLFQYEYGSSVRDIYRVNVDDIPSTQTMEEIDSCNFPYYHTVTFTPDGFIKFQNNSFYTYYYEDISTDDEYWNDDEECVIELSEDNPYIDMYGHGCQRFVIGNSMIILATDYRYVSEDILGDTEVSMPIYFCEDMDFANPKEIGRIEGINLFINNKDNQFGVYNNTFYAVEETADGSLNLVTVTSDGNMTRTPIAE